MATKKEYLSGDKLKNVVPAGRRIFTVKEIDKKYEFYYVGYVPPEKLLDEESKGIRPVFFHDLSQDVVKCYDFKTKNWGIVPGAPKYAADQLTGEFVGEVEDDEPTGDSPKVSPADMLKMDI